MIGYNANAWGNAAEWAAAIFGSGALVVALLALRSERADRKAAEARLRTEQLRERRRDAARVVVSWSAPTVPFDVMTRDVEVPKQVRRLTRIEVTNRSTELIREIAATVENAPVVSIDPLGDADGTRVLRRHNGPARWDSLAEGASFVYLVDSSRWSANEREVRVEWTDIDGNRWRRFDGVVEVVD